MHHDNPQISPRASKRPASFNEGALPFARPPQLVRGRPHVHRQRQSRGKNRGVLARRLNENRINRGDSREFGLCPERREARRGMKSTRE